MRQRKLLNELAIKNRKDKEREVEQMANSLDREQVKSQNKETTLRKQ